MDDDQPQRPRDLEEALKIIADEINRTVERIVELPVEEWIGRIGEQVRGQAERVTRPSDAFGAAQPSPLDVPSDEQGTALAAVDSGRWVIEPGTSMLVAAGEGPAPRDALGLVRELRVRDWLDLDGQVTVAGRAALRRWLER
jgi:hypothetical protein